MCRLGKREILDYWWCWRFFIEIGLEEWVFWERDWWERWWRNDLVAYYSREATMLDVEMQGSDVEDDGWNEDEEEAEGDARHDGRGLG